MVNKAYGTVIWRRLRRWSSSGRMKRDRLTPKVN